MRTTPIIASAVFLAILTFAPTVHADIYSTQLLQSEFLQQLSTLHQQSASDDTNGSSTSPQTRAIVGNITDLLLRLYQSYGSLSISAAGSIASFAPAVSTATGVSTVSGYTVRTFGESLPTSITLAPGEIGLSVPLGLCIRVLAINGATVITQAPGREYLPNPSTNSTGETACAEYFKQLDANYAVQYPTAAQLAKFYAYAGTASNYAPLFASLTAGKSQYENSNWFRSPAYEGAQFNFTLSSVSGNSATFTINSSSSGASTADPGRDTTSATACSSTASKFAASYADIIGCGTFAITTSTVNHAKGYQGADINNAINFEGHYDSKGVFHSDQPADFSRDHEQSVDIRAGQLGIDTCTQRDGQTVICAVAYYDPEGIKLTQSTFDPVQILTMLDRFGIGRSQLKGLEKALDKSGVPYKPYEEFPGTGSDHGINLTDLANGGLGTAYDWRSDPNCRLKGPTACTQVNANALLADKLDLEANPSVTKTSTNSIQTQLDDIKRQATLLLNKISGI